VPSSGPLRPPTAVLAGCRSDRRQGRSCHLAPASTSRSPAAANRWSAAQWIASRVTPR